MLFSVVADGYKGILASKMKIIICQEHMVSLWRRKMLTGVVPHCTSAALPRSCIQHETCSFACFLPHPQRSICFPTLTTPAAWPDPQLSGAWCLGTSRGRGTTGLYSFRKRRVPVQGSHTKERLHILSPAGSKCDETPCLKVRLFPH